MACREKGVPYELVPLGPMPRRPRRFIRRPIPVMRHGDFVLTETSAIARYIDRAFDGPPLMPADGRAAARADQWISAVCDYLYQSLIRDLVLPRLVFPAIGRPTDEAAIAASEETRRKHLAVVEATLAKSDHLAGKALTLADLFLAPILYWAALTPEGKTALDGRTGIARWHERIAARPSFKDTVPPLPEARSAA
jgi:glutathione S-transferase